MANDKYSFRPLECWKCGESLAGAKSPVTGMKGNVPLGYCPKCGAFNPLTDVEPTDEPKEPPEPTGEGTGEGEGSGEPGEEGTGEGGEGSEEPES